VSEQPIHVSPHDGPTGASEAQVAATTSEVNEAELRAWRDRALVAESQLAEIAPPMSAVLWQPGAGFRLVQCDDCGRVLGQLDDNDGIPSPLRDSMEQRLRAAHHCDDTLR
jgi:hypothetical protein